VNARGPLLFAALSAVLAFSEGVRIVWFAWRVPSWEDEPVLHLSWPPDGSPGFERMDLAATRGGQALDYDHGDLVRLFDPESSAWSMDVYYLEYEAGNGRQLTDLFVHSPEVCLRASGSRLIRTLPRLEALIDGRPVQARHLVFQHAVSRQEYHVFKLVWLGRMRELGFGGEENDFRKVRLKAAAARLARPPARMILASVSGVRTDEEARRRFTEEVLSGCEFQVSLGP
jgi:hypothetical protein